MTNPQNETAKPTTAPVTPAVNPQAPPQQTQGDNKPASAPQQK